MPGISTSVMTRSKDWDLTMARADLASGAWRTSNPPRLPRTWAMNRAVTASSSTTMIRPSAPEPPLPMPATAPRRARSGRVRADRPGVPQIVN